VTDLPTAAHLVNAAREQLDHAERALFTVLADDPEPGTAMCGKPSGYMRHIAADEPTCAACRAAHRWGQGSAS
jgi:hypothetical protein